MRQWGGYPPGVTERDINGRYRPPECDQCEDECRDEDEVVVLGWVNKTFCGAACADEWICENAERIRILLRE